MLPGRAYTPPARRADRWARDGAVHGHGERVAATGPHRHPNAVPASRDNHAPVAITAVSAVSGLPLAGYTVTPLPELNTPELRPCACCPPVHDCFSQGVHEAAGVDEALTVDVQRGGDHRRCQGHLFAQRLTGQRGDRHCLPGVFERAKLTHHVFGFFSGAKYRGDRGVGHRRVDPIGDEHVVGLDRFLVERHVGPHRPLPRRSPAVGGELDQEAGQCGVGAQRNVQGAAGSSSERSP